MKLLSLAAVDCCCWLWWKCCGVCVCVCVCGCSGCGIVFVVAIGCITVVGVVVADGGVIVVAVFSGWLFCLLLQVAQICQERTVTATTTATAGSTAAVTTSPAMINTCSKQFSAATTAVAAPMNRSDDCGQTIKTIDVSKGCCWQC